MLLTISQNSLYRGSLYQGLSVLINYFFQAKEEKEKKSLKKVSLAVVKQRRKETGTSELLKTLDEYVSLISDFY